MTSNFIATPGLFQCKNTHQSYKHAHQLGACGVTCNSSVQMNSALFTAISGISSCAEIHVQLQEMLLKWGSHSFCYLLRWKQVRNQVCHVPSNVVCEDTASVGSLALSSCHILSFTVGTQRPWMTFSQSPAVLLCPQYFSFICTCSSCMLSN